MDAGGAAGAAQGGSGGAIAFNCESDAAPGEMVDVAASDFSMGCDNTSDQCVDDELPQHPVTLSAFQIDRTEVTQDQYTACVVAGSCDVPSCAWDCELTNYPATCVSWSQAKTYCEWAQKRLPTEAEWEKAARGEQAAKYPWGNADP
ncbi:MAG TPA: formylglycine-generating enzyme family protein, partial [Polyangiaceae bacterium]|nr:formylglycine-generating enzyme family protein [Polyangiaceae bacterium]